MRGPGQSDERRAEIRARWNRGEPPKTIRKAMGLTKGQFARQRINLNLHTPIERRRYVDPNNAATLEGRTRFPSTVTDEGAILKLGAYQTKLGGRVTKGAWKSMPIYAITLEERKTCPRECKLWSACYGNQMQYARRMRHGPEMERRLWDELAALQSKHGRRGFVVRAHILGDFYSIGIVELWREALDAFPGLHVFGYTARQDRIGRVVAALRDEQWDRFAVRTSGAVAGPRTLVIEREEDCPPGTIVCPAQTGRTASCGTCSLCWASKKPVAFIRH